MPFAFTLPTTSHLSLNTCFISSTHPSLPYIATSHRTVLRSALKAQKHSPDSEQSSSLWSTESALKAYIPYLLALDAGLSGRTVSDEEVDVTLTTEAEVEWRPTLSSSNVPGREAARVKGRGLDYEIHSVLQTFATVQTLLARQALLSLYSATTPAAEQRVSIVLTASKCLMVANSIHHYLLQRTQRSSDVPPSIPPAAVDISFTLQTALAELSLAEATLLAVLKDDPYPAMLIRSRNKNDREWMIKAPDLPRVRAHLFARLCLSTAEHSGTAVAVLRGEGSKIYENLVKYCENLRRTSRAKACRFLAIDADLGGETGKGIAWLRGGMGELGLDLPRPYSAQGVGFSKLKDSWNEKREDKRLEKGRGDWGSDAGKAEEGRLLAWLEQRYTKMNDTVNVQLVPDSKALVAAMPSGRDILNAEPWKPMLLNEDELGRMRAPPDIDHSADEEHSSDDEDDAKRATRGPDPVGAFPGTRDHYRTTNGNEYY